jgi:hypothetical protein
MAKQSQADNLLSEHPVVSKLLAEAGPDAKAYRGYPGRADRSGFVTIYPSLADLGRSFEIREADIVHVERIPEAIAPFDAIMVWVRADAEVSARAVATANKAVNANANEAIESRQGRLRMVRRSMPETMAADSCTSNCECVSNCDPCVSICRWTCTTRPQ